MHHEIMDTKITSTTCSRDHLARVIISKKERHAHDVHQAQQRAIVLAVEEMADIDFWAQLKAVQES